MQKLSYVKDFKPQLVVLCVGIDITCCCVFNIKWLHNYILQ